jgi:hypothetical protein
MGVHPSSYYRWRRQLVRFGPEILRPRERRAPKMPNQTSPMVEQRVLAFSLAHPGFGPARISAELRRPKWGGIRLSPNGVHRVLARHGLSTRAKRLSLIAGYAAPPSPRRPEPEEPRHLQVDLSGQMVQIDCFFVGRLSGTKGSVWQYTAIDVGSSFCWAELHTTPKNPSARWTSHLAERVAADLAARGWRLQTVMTDNASEFRSQRLLQHRPRAHRAVEPRQDSGRRDRQGEDMVPLASVMRRLNSGTRQTSGQRAPGGSS